MGDEKKPDELKEEELEEITGGAGEVRPAPVPGALPGTGINAPKVGSSKIGAKVTVPKPVIKTASAATADELFGKT